MSKVNRMAGWEPRVLASSEVREALSRLKWTQQMLAVKLGISSNTVSRWTTGASEIPVWLADYLDALEVTYRPSDAVAKPRQLTGEDLKSILLELGWTQTYLARRIDVVKTTVSRWGTGEYIVPAWVCAYLVPMLEIRRIAVRLGVSK